MTSFFGVTRNQVVWTGLPSEIASSDGRVRRGFCADCGTQLFYQSRLWPDETHLYAATLEDPAMFKPQAHYHYGEKLPWLGIQDDLPKFIGSADDGTLVGSS